MHFLSDHAITFTALPIAPDRTLVRTTWLVHEDAEEGIDYDLAKLTDVWHHTNAQDSALVEPRSYRNHQSGIHSRAVRTE